MNKKLLLSILAGLGIVSLFMPWVSVMGFGASLMSSNSGTAFVFIILFAVIMVLSLLEGIEKPFDNNKAWGVLIVSAISLVINILNIFSFSKAASFGASIGIGYYFCFLVSIALTVLAYMVKKGVDMGEKSLNIDIDKDKVMEATKKGWDAAKTFTKAAGKATKSAVEEIKKEMKKGEDSSGAEKVEEEIKEAEVKVGEAEVKVEEVKAEVEEVRAEAEEVKERVE